jgi:hypothetical protein
MYFHTVITEEDGKTAHTHNYLVVADNTQEAVEKVRDFASGWYPDDYDYDADKDQYLFFGGEIMVEFSPPIPTTLEAFVDHIKNLFVIE